MSYFNWGKKIIPILIVSDDFFVILSLVPGLPLFIIINYVKINYRDKILKARIIKKLQEFRIHIKKRHWDLN